MEFSHEGIKIILLSSGAFSATVAGRHVIKPSLAAMKAHITAAHKTTFEPFTALREPNYRDRKKSDLIKVNVVGIEIADRATKYRAARHRFVTDKIDDYSRELMVDSKENVVAFKTAKDYEIESDKIATARRDRLDQLRAQIKLVRADDYVMKS